MDTLNNPLLSTNNININIKYALPVEHDNNWYEVKAKYEYAFWIIQKGALSIDYNQKQYTLHAGDVFLFYPQILYHASSSVGCSFIFIHFDAVLGHNCQALHFYPFDGMYTNNQIKKELDYILSSYLSFEKDAPFSDLSLKGSLMLFLANIMNLKYQSPENLPEVSNKSALARLHPTLIYINHHISEPIYMQDLADTINLSEKYFITFFKKAMGISPANYITQVKMKKALEYLHEQNYSVKEVATLVGYSDIYTFSKVFKKTYGVSPSKI